MTGRDAASRAEAPSREEMAHAHGSRDFQRESVTMRAWSVVLHILVIGAVGTLVYWTSALPH